MAVGTHLPQCKKRKYKTEANVVDDMIASCQTGDWEREPAPRKILALRHRMESIPYQRV